MHVCRVIVIHLLSLFSSCERWWIHYSEWIQRMWSFRRSFLMPDSTTTAASFEGRISLTESFTHTLSLSHYPPPGPAAVLSLPLPDPRFLLFVSPFLSLLLLT